MDHYRFRMILLSIILGVLILSVGACLDSGSSAALVAAVFLTTAAFILTVMLGAALADGPKED